MSKLELELLALVRRAIIVLQEHSPGDGISDRQAMDKMYEIFDGPECNELFDSKKTGLPYNQE